MEKPNNTINQKDSQGRKQGYWEDTATRMILNPSGNYIEKGNYIDDLREGVWETWTIKDNSLSGKEGIFIKRFYRNDFPLGVQEHYDIHTGELESVGLVSTRFDSILKKTEFLYRWLPSELVTVWPLLQAALGGSHFSLWGQIPPQKDI